MNQHPEMRKLKIELERKREEYEDLREELKEMTQMYLVTKQERDKYKSQIDMAKRQMQNMDKIIKDNVIKALKAKEGEFRHM